MNECVLIVDDEPDIMRILSYVLNEAGFRVIPAYGAEDAMRKVKLHKIDLILTDLAMPKVSGVEIIQQVKGDPQTKHIPVIAVTAHTWEGLAQSAGEAGCDGFIPKPFNNRQLVLDVRKFLKASKP